MSNIKTQPHLSLDVERLLLNHPYAFTINPAKQWDHDYDPDSSHDVNKINADRQNEWRLLTKDRLRAHTHYMKRMLEQLHGSTYCLNFESSSTGRLHWHGYLIVTDIREFVLWDLMLLKHIGAYDIEEIGARNDSKEEGITYWAYYIAKQKHIWRTSIKSLKFPITIFDDYLDDQYM